MHHLKSVFSRVGLVILQVCNRSGRQFLLGRQKQNAAKPLIDFHSRCVAVTVATKRFQDELNHLIVTVLRYLERLLFYLVNRCIETLIPFGRECFVILASAICSHSINAGRTCSRCHVWIAPERLEKDSLPASEPTRACVRT